MTLKSKNILLPIITIILVLASHVDCKAQDYFFWGSERIKISKPMYFGFDEEFTNRYIGPLKMTFGKRKDGRGLIILESGMLSTNSDYTFYGKVYFYLSNNQTVTCVDRGLKGNTNNKNISLYYLSKAEEELLKNADIENIMLTIGMDFSNQTFTASTIYVTNTSKKAQQIF